MQEEIHEKALISSIFREFKERFYLKMGNHNGGGRIRSALGTAQKRVQTHLGQARSNLPDQELQTLWPGAKQKF
ncbi:hypothetical protein D1BOALGB6SA_4642 [Olavius sp. associated proteobacterium Delta 1]|nr:hypothetical protein D1BOALGB6SA_4642 [Olavius sp. associated proteobacterium Delta 1]